MDPQQINNPPQNTSPDIDHVRTYKDDIANAIQKKKTSAVKIAIAESKRSEKTESIGTKTPEVSKNNHLLLISSIFIVLGAGILSYVYFVILNPNAQITTPLPQIQTIITADKQKEFGSLTPNLKQVLFAEVTQASLSVNQIENVYLATTTPQGKQVIDSETFLHLINVSAPDSFIRSLESEYMFGIHGLQHNEPFLILKTHFYENAYAGMLAWEPNLYADFKAFIIPTPTPQMSTSTATSTPEDNFDTTNDDRTSAEDMVIRNKDVRVLRDRSGNNVLMYSFVDTNTIVITTNETTLREIIDRLEKKVYTR